MQKQTVDLVRVVSTDMEMKPMSPTNTTKNRVVGQEAAQKRIVDESHKLIPDEVRRWERLEFDPSRVFVAADEDSESDEGDED